MKNRSIIEQIVRKSDQMFHCCSSSHTRSLVFLEVSPVNVRFACRHNGFTNAISIVRFEELGVKNLTYDILTVMTSSIIDVAESVYPKVKLRDLPSYVVNEKTEFDFKEIMFCNRNSPTLNEWGQ